ncbi:MAG: twin-arginine translocation signal domain-containing protein, partial [Planctomycetota bacterium]
MADDKQQSQTPSSRREFLKKSAAGAATVYGLSIARGAHAAGDEAIKIGMIGCGGRCSGAAGAALGLGKDV